MVSLGEVGKGRRGLARIGGVRWGVVWQARRGLEGHGGVRQAWLG